ncbi:N-acyltransferase YncA [Novipirellula aureliae]|uniref:N-acyltransferase YncA n=1 Tax=Novipirellula aureliae TaxID=2527966 RepID=A0A5C6E8P2_9BACT|nr:GNAT family N-acetyltransferase [Novipirellula aureliae]TWU45352.1 N-acyltransferase YncA [Novipirellula aureliae]
MNLLNIRKAVSDDAEQIAAIYNLYVDQGGSTFDTVHQTCSVIAGRIGAEPPEGWYVSETNGRVSGWACARRYSERQGFKLTCETAIYISPSEFGKGIADQLQFAIDQHCMEHHLHHAVARIIADNQRSMAFHYRHGFELVGIQKEIGWMNNAWVDLAILQKLYRSST